MGWVRRATDAASAKKIEFHGFVLWRFAGRKMGEMGHADGTA
jgi:hypothetical protein